MKTKPTRRRPSVHITLSRAARLHHLIVLLVRRPRDRESLLKELAIGLRTFYRELELLKRCGVKVRYREKAYLLESSYEHIQERLPFPDPQLSFAEMAELSRHPGETAKRLALLLESVTNGPAAPKKRGRGRQGAKPG